MNLSSNWYLFNFPVTFPCKVVNIIDSAYGKFPDIEGDIDDDSSSQGAQTSVILEMSNFIKTVSDFIPISFSHKGFKSFLSKCSRSSNDTTSSCSIFHYIDYLALNLQSPRSLAYQSSDYDAIQRRVTQEATRFLQTTKSIYILDSSFPILKELKVYNMALTLLSLIFKVVIMVFAMISFLVVQSLVMVSIERE